VELGNNASDTCTIIYEAYGGEAMKRSRVFEWHKQFKDSSQFKITVQTMFITFSIYCCH